MFNHEIFAVSMGRALAQLRAEPPDRAAQKAALRAVHDLTSLSSAALRLYDGVLSIDDVAIAGDLPAIPQLVERLHEHGLAEVTIARGAPPSDLLVLLRTLAGEPERTHDAGTVKRHLGKAAAASIVVLPVKGLDAVSGRRAASVTQAFEQAAIDEATAEQVPAEPVPAEPPRRRTIRASAAAPQADHEPTPLAQPGAPAAEWLAPSAVRVDTPLGAALQAVTLEPYGSHILDRLAELGRAVERALRDGEDAGVARALATVVALEPGAPEGTPRSSYAITLRRALTRSTLDRLARLATSEELATVVGPVLHRGGADGVEALLALLTSAETMRERKAYMTLLKGSTEGTDRVLAMLYRPEWFVVRNLAELVGELRLEDAVPQLSELLGHEDARVRRAVAAALAKIGTVPTVEPLRRELREGTPELRAFVASCIGGPHARALAMPLVALADDETEPVVLIEYYGALGRIGTPEAVQALAKAAQSAGRLLRRTPPAVRVAAVEALRHAGGPAARRALEALVKDGDRTVRAAAQKALGGLTS
jgi:HEAT repeat protein